MSFDPPTVFINVGDTVQWVWVSSGHSVRQGDSFNEPNPLFDSLVQDQPFTFSFTFTDPGTSSTITANLTAFLGMMGVVNVAGASADAHSDANTHADPDANADTHPNADANTHSDTDTDAHTDSNSDAHPDCDSHSDTYRHT